MVELSIIIPAYNEENRIRSTVECYMKYFKNYDFELIIIPNGCKDKTEEIVIQLSKEYKQIKVNEVSGNKIISLKMLEQSEWFIGIKLVDIIKNIIEITN